MGEREQLNGPLAGQFGLNDFLAQQNSDLTPRDMIRSILPVQEMRHFQRRYVFSSGKQTLEIGEELILRWTVPENEWWRPRTLMFTNKDSTSQFVIVTFTVDNTGDNVYRAVRTRVDLASSQVVYGQDIDGSIGTATGRFASRLPSIMEPGDVMTMAQQFGVTIQSEQSWILIYELVPQPAVALVRGPDAAVTVT